MGLILHVKSYCYIQLTLTNISWTLNNSVSFSELRAIRTGAVEQIWCVSEDNYEACSETIETITILSKQLIGIIVDL